VVTHNIKYLYGFKNTRWPPGGTQPFQGMKKKLIKTCSHPQHHNIYMDLKILGGHQWSTTF
jgi:hypothetical protein